ncbi:MAG: 6-carboxytetrahydropterin synthase [Chitinophagales bacterium]
MIYLTRVEHFNAAHKLYNHNWTAEKNKEVFGKCCNANFHGHNFDLYVTVKGNPNPDTGFVMNAHDLSKLIKDEICDKFDHKNLNLDVEYFKSVQPSSENFIKVIWQILNPLIQGCELHGLKLMETPRIYVEYFGE